MFLTTTWLTVVMAIVNLAVFFIEQAKDNANQTTIIIIVSVIAGVLCIPLLCFFLFHLFLAITGNTTRQCLKKIANAPEAENQWCKVDEPLFDPYE